MFCVQEERTNAEVCAMQHQAVLWQRLPEGRLEKTQEGLQKTEQ
jgi:hypothetical protein